jgi:tetratricopeptide (TPR) repeat protein
LFVGLFVFLFLFEWILIWVSRLSNKQTKQYEPAKEAYEKVLKENANNPKVLHRLGWLLHQFGTPNEQEAGHNHLVQSIQLGTKLFFVQIFLKGNLCLFNSCLGFCNNKKKKNRPHGRTSLVFVGAHLHVATKIPPLL